MKKPNETSLEQFYTNKDILQHCGETLRENCPEIKSFIDFSCGKNEFVVILKSLFPQLQTVSFDIDPPKYAENMHEIIVCDYLELNKNILSERIKNMPRPLSVGINPPFGLSSHLARRFIKKSIELFEPEFLTIISPGSNKDWMENKIGIDILYNERLPNDSFHIPSGKKMSYPTRFIVAKYDPNLIIKTNTIDNPIKATRSATVKDSYFAIRRLGVNILKQAYFWHKKNLYYWEKGETPQLCREMKHKADNNPFCKIISPLPKKITTLKEWAKMLEWLSEQIPEGAYERQPPSVCNNLISKIVYDYFEHVH